MTDTTRGLLIPEDGEQPIREIHINKDTALGLDQMQDLVGGNIQPIPIPEFVKDSDKATVYVNEDGKYNGCKPNMRATDFMVPGVGLPRGLFFGDYIAGNMIVIGFDPDKGEDVDIPEGVEKRVRLIESEAA